MEKKPGAGAAKKLAGSSALLEDKKHKEIVLLLLFGKKISRLPSPDILYLNGKVKKKHEGKCVQESTCLVTSLHLVHVQHMFKKGQANIFFIHSTSAKYRTYNDFFLHLNNPFKKSF